MSRPAVRRVVLALALCLIAVLALSVWSPSNGPMAVTDAAAPAVVKAVDRPTDQAGARPVADAPAPAASAVHGELFNRLKASTNHREFVHYALEHPELGGAYYANVAWAQCTPVGVMDLKRLNIEDPTVKREVDQVIQRLSTACDSLEAQFGGASNLAKLIGRVAKQGRDPLLAISKQTAGVTRTAKEIEDFTAALRLAQDSGDPYVLAHVVADIGPALMAIAHGEAVLSLTPKIAHLASAIVGCEIGGYCVGNAFAFGNCMQKEPCTSIDYRDQIRGALKEDERAQLDKAIILLRQAL